MAKSSEKKRIAENSKFLSRLGVGIGVSNALYVVVRLVLKNSSCTSWNYVAFAISSGLLYVTYTGLKSALEPSYDIYGKLIFAGSDLAQGGALSYYQDVAYLCMFALSLGSITNYAWLVMLLIPLYAAYLFYTYVLGPGMSARGNSMAGAAEQLDDVAKKRQLKKERQAARAEKFRR